MKLLFALVALAAASPALAQGTSSRGYAGAFTVRVTEGGYFLSGPSGLQQFSQVGQIATLRWSTIASTNVPSPFRPSEILPVLRTNDAGIGLPGLSYSSNATNDPFFDIGRQITGAVYEGDETAGRFVVFVNSNSAFDSAVSFSFTNGAIGSGEASVLEENFGSYGGRIKYDIIGGSAYAIVPEPAAWTFMMLGFFALGAAVRARLPLSRGLAAV